MRNAPSQATDDLLFEELFSERGEQRHMARLMGVSETTMKRMLVASDENHPSDYHRGRRLAYAAGYRQDDKGKQVKAGLDEAYEAGARDKLGPVTKRVKFPARLAHEVVEIELNTAELDSIPATRRLQLIRRLIRDLQSYEAGLMIDDLEGEDSPSGDGEGLQRAGREADSPEPQAAAVS